MDPGIIHALAVLESEPDNADALAQLAGLSQGGGNGHGQGKGDKREAAADLPMRRALTEARRIHRERGDFELVARLIDLELGWETDKSRQADLYFEKGKVLADELLREKEAVAAFGRVLELRADDEGAKETLATLQLVRDNWKKIVKKQLDEAKESTERQLTTSLYLSVAELYAKYEPDDHVEQYLQKAIEVEPRNHKASLRLERIYRGEGRWEDLARLVESRIEAAASKEERVSSYLTLADVQAKRLGKRNEAAESFKKALGIDPANGQALRALVDFYTVEENWQSLIRVYENALRARPRGEPELGMLVQIGMLWWKKLGNLDSADEHWKKVRKSEPAHPAMVEFYRELYKGDAAKLLPVLQQAQKVEQDPKRRLDLSVEMARLADVGGTVEKAIELWKGVLKSEPGNAAATDALKRLYEKTEKWNALLELLKERIEAIAKDNVDERVERLLEVVAIYRDKLNLDVMVINTYNNILGLKPDHLGALSALAQKYEAMGRWNDLINVLTRNVDVAADSAEKVRLYRRIAGLWIDKFGNFNQAVKPLEELYQLAPTDEETMARLRDIYTRRRSWRALLDLERKELDRLTKPGDANARRQKLIEMAKLAAERLGDAREAIATWNRLLELDENDLEALAALGGLYEREKRWPAFIEILRRQKDRQPDAKAQVALLERIGLLYTERLSAPEQAIAAYQEIVKIQPSHQKAMRTLRELYAQGGRFAELEKLYAEQGQWEELCEVLLSVAERVADNALKLQLYFRVAEIAQRELKAPERAAKAYERILAIDGTNRDAANALVPIYRASEKWARLLATYEIVLGHAPAGPDGDDARLALHREIVALCEEKLGSKGLAFNWCAKAYALRPNDRQLEGELERLALEAEAWEELAELYAGQAARETDRKRQSERFRQLGRLSLQRLHRPEEARKHFEAVLERHPDDEEALSTLEQIFNLTQEWPALVAIYRRRESATKDPQRRLELQFKVAWIEEEQLHDSKAAIVTYRRVLEPSSGVEAQPATLQRALHALDKLYSAQKDWTGLHEVVERQLRYVGSDVDLQVQLTHQLGELCETKLDRRADALKHYRQAFRLSPAHKPTQAALERWLAPQVSGGGTPEDRVEVARLLVPIYEQRDDAPKLVEALEILLGATSDPTAQLDLLRRVAKLVSGPLGDAKRAYEFAGRIFERAPGDAENRSRMALLAEQLECPDDLAVRLGKAEEAAAARGETALARDLAWDLGQLCDVRLGMPDEAEGAYKRVLDRDPDHESAHIALVQLYSGNDRWADLRTLFEKRKSRAADNDARLGLLFSISDLDEGVLGDEPAAIRDYVEVLEIDPANVRAYKALDRLYTSLENWQALDDLLSRRVPHAAVGPEVMGTPESRAHIKYRRGELFAGKLDDAKHAADLYEEALGDEPRHESARKGLETLMKRPELRQRIARALEPFYISDEAWSKLALVLGAQREAPDLTPVEAAALAGRLAELQEEKLGARQLALQTWREALRLTPGDANVRNSVERLATMLGRWAELAAAWEEAFVASDPTDLQLRGELLEKAAEIYEGELGDLDKARGAWKRLLELDPHHLETARPAAAALGRLYQNAEQWPELIDVLHRQAEWATEPGEKKELLFRIGRIQEELLVEPKAAIRTYRELLEQDAEERDALAALEHLYQSQSEWHELVEILRRRTDLEKDPAARRELMWRIAQLTERELADGGEAIAGYHAILDEHPEDVPALDSLARLHESQKRPADLLDVLERRLSLATEKNEIALQVPLRMRIAALLDEFGRHDQALERYKEVLAVDPRHAGARAGVEALLEDEDLRLRAAEVLEPHYQAAGETDKLVQLHELWARHAPDPRERVQRLRQIAALREQRKEGDGGFDALSRAARFAVGEPDLAQLLDGLERAASAGLKPQLVALYRELGPDIMDQALQERVYLTVAGESYKLGDRATAREYYRRVLDATPDHPRALDELERIYQESREWDPLFEIYAQRAELAQGDDERRRHYLMLLAELCARELERPGEAIRAYEQVLEVFPNDPEGSTALEKLYLSAKRHVDLAELLERRLGFADDLDEAVMLRFRLAKLYDDELTDPDKAVENYRAALGGDPMHAGAIEALEKYLDDAAQRVAAAEVLEPVYAARHDWPQLIRIYQIRLQAADEHRLRLGLVRRIARLYEEQLEDLDDAFAWYGKVFREEPSDRAIRDQLSRLAGVLGAWPKLAAVYEEWLADVVGDESPMVLEVMRSLAAIYQDRVGDVDGAKKCYQRLLTIDPRDQAAFDAMEKLLERAERWRDLLEVYREAADGVMDAAEIERRKTLLFKQAGLLESKLNDADGAIDMYRAVLEVDPVELRALEALDRLFAEGRRWHDLIELLIRQLEGAAGASWISLKLRLGAIYESELDDKPTAIDTYEEVLQKSASEPEAVRALERLIIDHDHTFRIAQVLEPIYQRQDAWQKLVVIYDAELDFIDDKPRRIEILREIARVHEQRGGDGRLAFAPLTRAWTEEASDASAEDRETALYADLYRLARGLGLWKELVKALDAAVANTYDAELQARVHARLAEIQETQLANPEAAIESWRKVTAAKDDHAEAWKALERLLDAAGRTDELVAVLEKRGSLNDVPVAEQKQLAYRTAELYERSLNKPEQAIGTWRHVLTLDEDDRLALDSLERLYLSRKSFRDLAAVYARQIELVSDAARRRKLRFELAAVQEKELHDSEAAIEVLRGAVAGAEGADPRDADAIAELARLYEGEKQWVEHLDALDALAALASGQGERELLLRAAQVLESQIGDVDAAIKRYQTILESSPQGEAAHLGARQALERLVRNESTRDLAADVLEPFYGTLGDYAAQIELTELRLAAESDPAQRRALLARIAELNEAGIEDLQAAFAAWGRVLAEDAGDAAAQAELERLAEVARAPGELARLYEERLAASFDPEVQRTLAWKLGLLYENKLGDDAHAITAYGKALELPGSDGPGGDDRGPMQALDRLLLRAGRWRDLAEVLEKEAQAGGDPREQAEFFFRLGALRAGELGDQDGALQAFKDALEREATAASARDGLEKLLASPAHAEAALDILEPLYEADGNSAKSVQLAEVRLTITSDKHEQAALLERIAEKCESELRDLGRAIDAEARALKLKPDETHIADEVERLARAWGAEAKAGDIFEEVISAGAPAPVLRDLGLRTARLWLRLARPEQAEERFLGVLTLENENAEALVALEQIYRARGDQAPLAEILERRAEEEFDVAGKKQLLAEAASLHAGPLSDRARAVEVWKKVLDADEADDQALDALAGLYEVDAKWAELVEALQAKARFAEDHAVQLALKLRIASLYADRLKDLDKAVEAYRDLLDLAPESLSALEALESLETQRGDWTAVQEVLVRRLQAVGAGVAQVPVYKNLAGLAVDKHQSPEDAIGYLHEVLAIVPDDADANQTLSGLLERTEKWHDLIDVLTEQANRRAAAGDKKGEVALLVRAADLWEQKLGSAESATELLERILERDPSSARALMSLARIYEAAHDLEKCRATLERAAELASSPEEAAELHYRMGHLEADAHGDEAGEEFYSRAIDADPHHDAASRALEQLARARGDWERVAYLLSTREQLARAGELTPEAQRALWLELGNVYVAKLKQPQAALPYLERAVKAAPDDPAVLEPLADLYLAAGKYNDALPLYRSLVEKVGKGKRSKDVGRLHFRIGQIAEKSGNPLLALDEYNAAYQIDPGHTGTLEALGRLYLQQSDWEKARRIYRAMLLANLDPSAGVSKADVYLHLGEIHEKLGEGPKAIGMYERGLELDGTHARLKEALGRVKKQ